MFITRSFSLVYLFPFSLLLCYIVVGSRFGQGGGGGGGGWVGVGGRFGWVIFALQEYSENKFHPSVFIALGSAF